MPRQDQYGIGWICALPHELAASRAMLDEEHEDLDGQDPGDHNAYTLGCVDGHNVVMACLPAGKYGTETAATVAKDMLRTFKSLRFGLLVGIGGGVPTNECDIRLGDVVVSQPSKQDGGVLQYDVGKALPNETFERRGSLNRPPDVLLNALSKLKSSHEMRDPKFVEYLDLMYKRYPRMRKEYVHPGSQYDHLYETICPHGREDGSCNLCETPREIHRASRPNDSPSVHYGLIASGRRVIASAAERDRLRATADILSFETEAAGLMDTFPCLVIRGICDYADRHKRDLWQRYAAAGAAAYAKELLQTVQRKSVQETSKITIESEALPIGKDEYIGYQMDLMSRTRMEMTKGSSHDRYAKEIFHRISAYDPGKVHRRLIRKRYTGSVEWFLKEPRFSAWLENTRHSIFWCTGTIGTGKTFLATGVVEHFQTWSSETGNATLFFYCDTLDPMTTRATYVLASLIKQLLYYMFCVKKCLSMRLQQKLESVYSLHKPDPDAEDLVDLCSEMFSEVSCTAVVVDGLDEICESDIRCVLNLLERLANRGTLTHVFLSSRKELGHNVTVPCAPDCSVHLYSQMLEHSIRCYVEDKISYEYKYSRPLTQDERVLETVKQRLVHESNGMFLWVRLQLEAMWEECFDDNATLEALESLPPTLHETYLRCLKRIKPVVQPYAQRILHCVCGASRPLKIQELQELVSINLEDTNWTPSRRFERSIITSCCANLVELDWDDECVSFSHPSVKTFLSGESGTLPAEFEIIPNRAELACGELSVKYLSFVAPKLELVGTPLQLAVKTPRKMIDILPLGDKVRKLVRQADKCASGSSPSIVSNKVSLSGTSRRALTDLSRYYFLQYSQSNWITQTALISRTSRVWKEFEQFVLKQRLLPEPPSTCRSNSSRTAHFHKVLIEATKARNVPILMLLLEHKQECSLRQFANKPLDEGGLPALHIAARCSHNILELLLQVSNPRNVDQMGWTALHHAIDANQTVAIRILVDVPGTLLVSGTRHLNLFEFVLEHGNVNALNMIIDSIRKDPTAQDMVVIGRHLGQALVRAIDHEDSTAVCILMNFLESCYKRSRKSILDSKDSDGHTALSMAAKKGLSGFVSDLLALSKTQCMVRNNRRNTPLMEAVKESRLDIVEMLFPHNKLHLTLRDIFGNTPLIAAVSEFRLDDVLSHSLDENTPVDEEQESSLIASERIRLDVVKLLLPVSDPNSQNAYGSSALMIAVVSQHYAPSLELVKILLPVSDINMQDHSGETVLHLALRRMPPSKSITKILLADSRIKAGVQNELGETPLMLALYNGFEFDDISKTLAARPDANMFARTKAGKKTAHFAFEGSEESDARELLLALGFSTKDIESGARIYGNSL